MGVEEFSSGFDTLLSSYARSNVTYGDTMPDIRLDEYEKSFFLTKAQEELVLSLYTGKNPIGESFESSEEMRRYLSPLVQEAELSPLTGNNLPKGMESYSTFFKLPSNPPLWFITYESVTIDNAACERLSTLDVYPVTQDEYHKIKKNPFRGTNERRVLRLDLSDDTVEIIGDNVNITTYYIRYIKKLNPIILTNLTGEGVEINDKSVVTPCELHESLHQRILDRAVMLALQSKNIVGKPA